MLSGFSRERVDFRVFLESSCRPIRCHSLSTVPSVAVKFTYLSLTMS